jgi:hypothetical protein
VEKNALRGEVKAFFKTETTLWAGAVGQIVECLTNKHKALSSNSSTARKIKGWEERNRDRDTDRDKERRRERERERERELEF